MLQRQQSICRPFQENEINHRQLTFRLNYYLPLSTFSFIVFHLVLLLKDFTFVWKETPMPIGSGDRSACGLAR